MAVTPIVVHTAPQNAPVEFTINGTGDLTLRTAKAIFDGSGAGGDFIPCFAIYTPDGKLLSRTKCEQTVTAGDEAVVTFWPFRKSASVTPPPSGATLPVAAVYSGFKSQSYAPPGGDQVPFNSSAIKNDPGGVFSVSGAAQALLITVHAAGEYLLDIQMASETTPIVQPAQLRISGLPSVYGGNDYNRQTSLVYDEIQGLMSLTTVFQVLAPTVTPIPLYNQSSGGALFVDGNYMYITQLSPY